MSLFPVLSSILCPQALGDFLQPKYKLGTDTECSIIKTGVNHTYLLKSLKEQYIFRVYCVNWRSEKEIREELRLLTYLKDKGQPVSYAIPDREDAYLQELNAPEGKRFGVLFSFAKGEKRHFYDAALHYTTGEVMASLHRYTINFDLDRIRYTVDNLLVEPFDLLKKFIPEETEEMLLMTTVREYITDGLKAIKEDEVRTGAVHLDIWFDNLNITKKGKVSIFDFDFCGKGWLCLDVAYYLMQLYVVETDKNEYRVKAEAFLKGYESKIPLSAEEKRLLPLLGLSLYFFYLGVQCQRFDDWSNVFINETYLKRYIMMRIKPFFDFHQS